MVGSEHPDDARRVRRRTSADGEASGSDEGRTLEQNAEDWVNNAFATPTVETTHDFFHSHLHRQLGSNSASGSGTQMGGESSRSQPGRSSTQPKPSRQPRQQNLTPPSGSPITPKSGRQSQRFGGVALTSLGLLGLMCLRKRGLFGSVNFGMTFGGLHTTMFKCGIILSMEWAVKCELHGTMQGRREIGQVFDGLKKIWETAEFKEKSEKNRKNRKPTPDAKIPTHSSGAKPFTTRFKELFATKQRAPIVPEFHKYTHESRTKTGEYTDPKAAEVQKRFH